MFTLENREPRLVEYEIPVTVGGGQSVPMARVARVSDAQSRTASKELNVTIRHMPTTLTLTARGTKGATSQPLSAAHEAIPAIAKALLERRLVKHEFTAAVAADTPVKAGEQE